MKGAAQHVLDLRAGRSLVHAAGSREAWQLHEAEVLPVIPWSLEGKAVHHVVAAGAPSACSAGSCSLTAACHFELARRAQVTCGPACES